MLLRGSAPASSHRGTARVDGLGGLAGEPRARHNQRHLRRRAYRYLADPTARGAHAGVAGWLEVFLDATVTAASQVRLSAYQIGALLTQCEQQASGHGARQGVPASPRADSIGARRR